MQRGLLRPALVLAFVGLVLTFLVAVLLVWRPGGASLPGASPLIPPAPSGDAVVLVGAGDIAECGDDDDEQSAAIVDQIPGTVFLAGDNAYPDGSARTYGQCFGPSWGRLLDRTRPAPGNHEYEQAGAAAYLDYFGGRAAPAGKTWYSWDPGNWHVVMLDSNCSAPEVEGCNRGSEQEAWLRADLTASDARCTLAIWHHPRFSSGEHGNDGRTDFLWRALYDAGADVIVNGHDHDYERFAPQDPNGTADHERGIRQFVVGTGGAGLREFRTVRANSEVRDATTHGVIRLALYPDRYSWDFVPVAGRPFTDSGSGPCH
jgi:hypothetical protein